MLRKENSAAMRALATVMNIFVMFCAIFVFGISFSSCDTGIDDVVINQKPCEDGDCDGDGDTDPDPDAKVESVEKLGCDFGDVSWTAENATLTRSASEYVYANRDGGVFGNQGVDYIYSVVYNLPEHNHDDQKSYSLNNAVAAFNYKNTRYLAKGGDAIFLNEPQIKKDGNVTVLTWGEKEYVAFLATSIPSVSSLTIEGIEKRDLCTNGVSYTYEGFELIDNGSDDEYYHKTLRIYGKAEVTDASKGATQKFYIDKTYYIAKEGGITPPTPGEKEPIKYDLINKDETTNGVTGDLEVTYDDGSKEILGEINIRLNRSTFNNAEQTIKVNDFSYSKLEPSYANNLATGNVRTDSQLGCQISITEYKNTITMRTSKATCVMGGYWEYPVVIDPLGGEHAWDLTGWELSENSITDDGGNGNKMVLTYKASASYLSANETITSIVNLVKENGGGEDTYQTGAYAKDQRIEGKYIKWTLVRTYNNTNESETPMMIAHLGSVETESRKSTWNRTYAATTPSMVLKSQENFTDGNYSGTLSSYTSTFSYPDFTNVVTSQARNIVNYNDNGFDISVWNENLLLQKSGVDKGTSNISSDPSVKKYLDKINYSLKNGGTECATGIQEVEYNEKGEDPEPQPEYTYSVEKDKVEGNKLYFFKITKDKNSGAIISKDRDSQYLVFSLHATACNDWTVKKGEATGLTLSTTSHSYTEAKDYIFGSNRGNHTASASLQTEYKVSFMGNEYTLSISGTVNGSATLTGSTSSKNTYAFTAKLLADGVEIASDSDQAVETIEGSTEGDKTYSVEKDKVENGNLYYYEVITDNETGKTDKTRKSTPLIYSLSATACADWTAKEGSTGLSLSTTSIAYSGNKEYVFGSNRGNNIASASLQTEYSVTFNGNTYTLSISGTVNGAVAKTGSTSSTNTYTFTASLLADGVTIATDSDQAVETVEKEEKPEDTVTRSVEKIGVSGNNLNYYYIVKHSVNTELDSKTQHSVPVVASVTATACNDWTAKEGETGMSLTTSSHSYSGAQNYIFGSNRGNCTANASLQETYVVTHDGQNFTLTVSGTVTGSVSKSGNTYTFTANVLADGSVVASASDIAVETVEPEVNYIKVTSVDCTVGVSQSGYIGIVFVAHYEDGVSISDSGITGNGGNTVIDGKLGTLSQVGNVYKWGNDVSVPIQDFTYNGYGSPFIGCQATQSADGSVSCTSNQGGKTYTFPARSK